MQKQIEQTLTSLEVAEILKKQHKNLLADIRGYIKELNQLKIQPVDFFQDSTYIDNKGERRLCYNLTKKGCEFVAHKLTGIKGTEFTAIYINRFHDMEEMIKEGISEKKPKVDRTEIMLLNARTRQANMYYKLAQVDTLSPTYKSILVSKAAETLSGESIIPLPKIERKTYSAKEIGDKFGVSANKIGRIANKYNLKTEEYGSYYRDKKKNSDGECDTWRYYDTVIPVIAKFLQEVA